MTLETISLLVVVFAINPIGEPSALQLPKGCLSVPLFGLQLTQKVAVAATLWLSTREHPRIICDDGRRDDGHRRFILVCAGVALLSGSK